MEILGILALTAAIGAISAIPGTIYYLLNRKKINSIDWPAAPGEVFSAKIDRGWRPYRQTGPTIDILYWYKINEKVFSGQSRRFWPSSQWPSAKNVDRTLDKYRQGTAIEVHFKPTDPAVSVLEPVEFSLFRSWVISLAVLLVLLAVIAWGAYVNNV